MRSALAFFTLVLALSTFGFKQEDPLDEAQRLAAEGKFEEALQKHIWIHNHILETDRAYTGVRLSFALDAWVELGKKYPKAIAALTEIRDQKIDRLLKSEHEWSLFQDVAAINQYLKQTDSTVELFKKLDKSSPQFAAQVYPIAEEAIVKVGDYRLARKYVTNPMARLKGAQSRLESGLDRVKSRSPGNPARQAYERIFTDEVVRLITILKNNADTDAAKKVQEEALKSLDNAQIRNAF